MAEAKPGIVMKIIIPNEHLLSGVEGRGWPGGWKLQGAKC